METVEITKQKVLDPQIKFFTAKQALFDLNPEFFSERDCRLWVIRNLHDTEAPLCPGCRNKIADETTSANFWEGRRCLCKTCGKRFNAFTGTFLDRCHIGERKIFILAILTELNLHQNEIARLLDINPGTVRIWQSKFKGIEQVNNSDAIRDLSLFKNRIASRDQ